MWKWTAGLKVCVTLVCCRYYLCLVLPGNFGSLAVSLICSFNQSGRQAGWSIGGSRRAGAGWGPLLLVTGTQSWRPVPAWCWVGLPIRKLPVCSSNPDCTSVPEAPAVRVEVTDTRLPLHTQRWVCGTPPRPHRKS